MRDLVLVASSGGHLQQLRLLADRIEIEGDRRWITFDTPQSRSLLAGENVTHVPYMGPRDLKGLTQNLMKTLETGTKKQTESVVSTGAGMALAYLPLAAARGIPTYFIESATRVHGPSATGRILARFPKISLLTQHAQWADDQWKYAGSVFEGFEVIDLDTEQPHRPVKRIVVSLGTIRPYGFRRLLERLVTMIDANVEVVWQTGSTDVKGLGIDARPEIPHHELLSEIKSSDVLVAHAGTGIALTAFLAGVSPLLVPREAAHGEHVDDHQFQTADMLANSGLAVTRRVADLSADDLDIAASRTVIQRSITDPLSLAR